LTQSEGEGVQAIFQARVGSAFEPVDALEYLKAARREVGQDEFPAWFQDAGHFAKHLLWPGQVMESIHADHRIEAGVRLGQLFGVVKDVTNPTARIGLSDSRFGRPLLPRINVQRGDALRVRSHRGQETTGAGSDFQHVAGQWQGLSQQEFDAFLRIIPEAAKQDLALLGLLQPARAWTVVDY
jgi:hypothetical protein